MSRRYSEPEINRQDDLAAPNRALLNSRIPGSNKATIVHPENKNIRDDGSMKKPKDECCDKIVKGLTDLNQKRVQAELDHKTRMFRKYYSRKIRKIFQPDEYERQVGGEVPTQSPLLAALHAAAQKSSYLTPLPAMAYHRQIDTDSKYVREGQYNYGAQ